MMPNFPLLDSGAVAQYPANLETDYPIAVIRFLDGVDQRFPTRGRSLRRWEIRLDLLNDDEICRIEKFFEAQAGSYSKFSFPDPFTGELVPNCLFAAPSLTIGQLAPDVHSTSFWVMETYV